MRRYSRAAWQKQASKHIKSKTSRAELKMCVIPRLVGEEVQTRLMTEEDRSSTSESEILIFFVCGMW